VRINLSGGGLIAARSWSTGY